MDIDNHWLNDLPVEKLLTINFQVFAVRVAVINELNLSVMWTWLPHVKQTWVVDKNYISHKMFHHSHEILYNVLPVYTPNFIQWHDDAANMLFEQVVNPKPLVLMICNDIS